MTLTIGIITVRESDYHPNRRLLEAATQSGNRGMLIHPYRLWPQIMGGQLGLTTEETLDQPQVVLPRQGAQIGDACLALIRQFQLTGVALVNDLNAVLTARDKFLTQQVLVAAGLPCPDTVLVNDASGLFPAIDRLGGYPVVAKQVSGRQGDGVWCIDNRGDARQRVLPALDRRRGLMLQRYLPPENRRDIRVLVVGGKAVCAAGLVPPAGDFRANFHLGSAIRSIRLSADLVRLAVGAAAAVGCNVAGVDMILDAGQRPFILEVNYAPGFKGLEAASGLDIAGRIIRFAVQQVRRAGKTAAGPPPKT